jgi:hypothetical protein
MKPTLDWPSLDDLRSMNAVEHPLTESPCVNANDRRVVLEDPNPRTLHLPLKREYFEAIRDGYKTEEYRLCTPHWRHRLEGRDYAQIVLTLGYPARDDRSRHLVRKWNGFAVKVITHPHFGSSPVQVYAIDVAQ